MSWKPFGDCFFPDLLRNLNAGASTMHQTPPHHWTKSTGAIVATAHATASVSARFYHCHFSCSFLALAAFCCFHSHLQPCLKLQKNVAKESQIDFLTGQHSGGIVVVAWQPVNTTLTRLQAGQCIVATAMQGQAITVH